MFAKRNIYNRGNPKFEKDYKNKIVQEDEPVLEGDIKFENTPEG